MALSFDGARWLFEVIEGNRALTVTRTQLKEGFDWTDVVPEERRPLITAIETTLASVPLAQESQRAAEARALLAELRASDS